MKTTVYGGYKNVTLLDVTLCDALVKFPWHFIIILSFNLPLNQTEIVRNGGIYISFFQATSLRRYFIKPKIMIQI